MALVSTTKRLRDCRIWQSGDALRQEFDSFGLRIESVVAKIARLSRCDDLTPNEREYLSALIEVRAMHKQQWDE